MKSLHNVKTLKHRKYINTKLCQEIYTLRVTDIKYQDISTFLVEHLTLMASESIYKIIKEKKTVSTSNMIMK